MNLIAQFRRMYEQYKMNVETQRVMELGRVRQAIDDEKSAKSPNQEYFHSLEKRKTVLERELHSGRYFEY